MDKFAEAFVKVAVTAAWIRGKMEMLNPSRLKPGHLSRSLEQARMRHGAHATMARGLFNYASNTASHVPLETTNAHALAASNYARLAEKYRQKALGLDSKFRDRATLNSLREAMGGGNEVLRTGR